MECSSSPCLNGATCTEPTPNSYQCRCPPGVTGLHCEVVTFATFVETSFLQVSPVILNSIIQNGQQREKRSVDDIVHGFAGQVSHDIAHGDGLRMKRQVVMETLTFDLTFQTTVLQGVLVFYMDVSGLSCSL